MSRTFFIGWDVGGWNCDHNANSRDALVILDEDLRIVGTPWRGNLRGSINSAATSEEWVSRLYRLCQCQLPEATSLTLAVDTPLGFPSALTALIADLRAVGPIGESDSNPYLYRLTERRLFSGKRGPLSAIKDMIGSQATKGMHVLAKFASHVERCGVWTDGASLKVVEAYPAACRRSEPDRLALDALGPLGHQDLVDARVCALVASLFANSPEAFEGPPDEVPVREGWIWVPSPGMIQEHLSRRTQRV